MMTEIPETVSQNESILLAQVFCPSDKSSYHRKLLSKVITVSVPDQWVSNVRTGMCGEFRIIWSPTSRT